MRMGASGAPSSKESDLGSGGNTQTGPQQFEIGGLRVVYAGRVTFVIMIWTGKEIL